MANILTLISGAKCPHVSLTAMHKHIDYRFVGLALLWMALIFWFSSQPTLFALPGGLLDTIFKKSAHALAYAILWALWWYATKRQTLVAFVLTVAYAISDEYHQTFVPGRHGQWFDVGVDTLGVITAMAVAHFRHSAKRI